MYIKKTKIADLPAVYATAELNLNGRRYLAAASEARGERALIVDPETMETSDLWLGDTGVMNVVQIPGRNQLLAITKFYPIFQSKDAAICLLEPSERGFLSPWKMTEVLKLPFCHRIGIIENENGLFLLGCQLCGNKDFQEDWTQPGAIWAAPILESADGEWKFTRLFDGLTKNHGLYIDHGHQAYVCSENGVMHFDMEHYRTGESLLPTIVSTIPTSDLWLCLDKDEAIAGTIEPFHGDTLAIYSLSPTSYKRLTSFAIHFGHVVWTGTLFGQSAVVVGNRAGDRTLDIVFWRTNQIVTIDRDVEPTQITVYKQGDTVKILSANHGAGEVSLYTLSR